MALYGYHLDPDCYEMAWIGGFHNGTAIMFSKGRNEGRGYSVQGSYEAQTGPTWGWRTDLQLPESHQLVITHYNVPPPDLGPEAKAVETVYRRIRSA